MNNVFLFIQYEQNLLEKGWRQWRLLKIKRGVIRAMQEHETKKQLSEVREFFF